MSKNSLSKDSPNKDGPNDGGSRNGADIGVPGRLWAYYVRDVPLIFKMLFLTISVGVAVGFVIDRIQAGNMRRDTLAEIHERLKGDLLEARNLMDNYIKIYGQDVDMLAKQAVFIDYVKGLNKNEDKKTGEKNSSANSRIRYHDELPPWLSDTLTPKILLKAGYLILLDSTLAVREVYRTVSATLPDVLLKPSMLLLELSGKQSYITEVNGIPSIVKAGFVTEGRGDYHSAPPLGAILSVTPIDENFMADSMPVHARGGIYALVKHKVQNTGTGLDAGGVVSESTGGLSAAEMKNLQVVATNRNDLIPVGATLLELSNKYIISGKSFFDYGFSDILMGFVILESIDEVETAVKDRVHGGRKRRAFLAAALILSSLLVVIWLTYRVRALNSRVGEFSKNHMDALGSLGSLDDEVAQIRYGDDLYSLNARFSALVEQIVSINALMWKNLSELENSEERFRAISETSLGAIMMMDGKGRISYWNKAAERIFGYTAGEAAGGDLHELIAPEKYREAFRAGFEKFRHTGQGNAIGRTLELTALRKDGSAAASNIEFPVELSLSGIEIEGEWHAVGMIRDISQRKRIENSLREASEELEERVRLRTAELTAANEKLTEEVDRRVSAQEMLQRNYDIQNITGEVLQLSMESITLQEYLEYTLDLILSVKWLSLDGKGSIFLTDDSGAAAASGGPAAESGVRTPELVMKAQRGLAEVLLGRCRKIPFGTCLCGRAAQERSVVFADRLDERHDVKYPGIPPHGHYCVPIMSGGKVLGVINMYVKEGHKRDPIEENFITAVANTLGGAIERKRIEDELARNLDILDITGKVLQLSMEPITLEEQLVRTLDLILCVKWLSLDGKGSIFLADENSSELVMKAQRGLSEVLLGKCMKIPFGTCLCGRAALERKVVFADRIDERHDVMYPNIPPHGHYCVPIMSGAKVLGVINMYVKEGHKREPVEEDFITSVANTLSGTIERKRIEDELLSFNELLHTLIDNIPDSIYFKDMNNRFVMINKAKAQHSKTDLKEIIGKTDYDFMPEEQARQSFMDDQMVKNTGKSIKGKIEKISRRDGGDVWVSVVKLPWRDKNGTMVGTMGISRDITTLKNTEESLRKKERQLAYLAHHDALTGLPNRLLFDDRMKQTIAYARRYKQLFAVMFLDLDKFKHINDTLGHDCGDDLLRTVAGRLIRCVRESDTVARMGGDEFMILLIDAAGVYDGDTGGSPIDGGSAAASNSGSATASKGGSAAASNSPTPIEAGLRPENREAGEGNAPHHSPIEGFEIVARKIIAAVEEGFLLAGERHFITTSVGVSLFPQDGDDAEILVKKADIALYNAKESGRNNYKFYSPNMENNTSRNMDKMS